VPNYNPTYDFKTYSKYEPGSILDPIKSNYTMPPIPSSSFSPTFNYPSISTSYYSTPHGLDWIPKAPVYSSPEYKDLFTDYSKFGMNKQNTYIPMNMPSRIEASNFELTIPSHLKPMDTSYSKDVLSSFSYKPGRSPIQDMNNSNNSYTSPIGLPKDSSSVEISSIRQPVDTFMKPPLDQPYEANSSKAVELLKARTQSMDKLPPATKDINSPPIFVIDNFKQGARYEGEKVNNLRHGRGKFFYQDGGLYDGDWVRNKMEGHGKLYYKSGKIAYDGQWKDDEFCG
jgi:hypothetical protein